jgi:leucine dehydrogenase
MSVARLWDHKLEDATQKTEHFPPSEVAMLHSVRGIEHTHEVSSSPHLDLFQLAAFSEGGELHLHHHPDTGLRAIVAIDDTTLGPALGGCRCQPYTSSTDAIEDALRLSRAMTYKAALAGLPHGGGKAVLIRPQHIPDRKAYFEAFGLFVSTLAGRYITAEDMGTSVSDLDSVARTTPFVLGTSSGPGGCGDPSPYTAFGVRRGIEAAARVKLGRSELQGLRVAIQGVGKVGRELAAQLHELGCRLLVADVNPEAVAFCADSFDAEPVDSRAILAAPCDILAPCAGGNIINDRTIPRIKARIVAGSANNQLEHPRHGRVLQSRKILYAPDYVINAGGLMHVALSNVCGEREVTSRTDNIHDTLLGIFKQAQREHRAPSEIADEQARGILAAAADGTGRRMADQS